MSPALVDPTFLVIGAARSGTTTLHHCLREHPQVFVPAEKQPEPHFFYKSSEYAQGIDAYRRRWFSDWHGEPAVGEVSSSTLFGPESAARIARHYPGMQLVCLLRNPVDRAYSSYWHSVRNGLEELGFEEAIATEPRRLAALEGEMKELAPCAYLGRSQYGPQLERFLRHFPAEQLHVILFEEFVSDPGSHLEELFRFLGVEAGVEIRAGSQVSNASTPPDQPMDPGLRKRLARELEPSNRLLARLLGRDLSLWDD